MSLPQKLKTLRAEHNMTQAELGRQINVARATIAGYETRNRQPSYEKLTAIAETFQVSVDYLLDSTDEPIVLHSMPKECLTGRFFKCTARFLLLRKKMLTSICVS